MRMAIVPMTRERPRLAGFIVGSVAILAMTDASATARTITNQRPSKSEIICRQSFTDWKRDFGYYEAERIQHRCDVWRHGHGVIIYKTPGKR